MKKIFLLLVLVVLGCGEKKEEVVVEFLEPQPGETKNLSGFNRKYWGTYNSEHGAQLLILENKIIKITPYNILFHRSALDSITGDRNNDEDIKNYLENLNFKVLKISDDSVSANYLARDTIFNVSPTQVCRSLKGSYFLNYRYGETGWKVKRLDLNKNRLSISMIMPHDSLFHLLPVEEKVIIKNDSGEVVSCQMKPTKNELRKLIKASSFEEREVWIKGKN
ncbi:MAG: hypothetical protein J7604_00580 [Sporocytophaga sp.]|uniref:hypothetical protein n=1 Tax=Sporocytophaga sp. TaxID=2231183 RepID=UPI001B2EB999|nr:hypothetical protein [Sporocytophaga sp.]MBO9698665.1 hypothetical protein [Sporocytophaga sp.]